MHGFRRTLFLSHLGLVALTLLLLAVTLRGLVARYLSEQLRDRLITQSAFVRNRVAPHMGEEGFNKSLTPEFRGALQRELNRMARVNDVRLRVLNRETKAIVDTHRGPNGARELGRAYGDLFEVTLALGGDTNSEVHGSWQDGSATMFLAMPVRRKGAIVGCVLASSPVLILTPQVRDFARRLALVMAGVFALAIVLSIVLAQRLAMPVRRLEEATRSLAAGDLSVRVRMHRRFLGRGDEMDRLTREFNAMAEKLESTDEERRAFLADVSHELKTPLCAIKGSAETLRDGAWRNPQAAPKFAATIAEQSDRLIRLVGDLLKLARLEAASASLPPPDDSRHRRKQRGTRRNERAVVQTQHPVAPLGARELCERAANAVVPLFAERGVHLEIECTAAEVRGDADLLEQLLINLLANAARHSPHGSTTTLSAHRTSSGTLLQVRDQGHGIAPEHLSKLGRRFYRVEEGRDRDSGGSGLGLAICRRIALAHGGKLEIESEVGRGTTVSVWLPE